MIALAPIIATLSGSDTATALGIIAQSGSPVLELCRKLNEAGHDPHLPLHVYRGATLTLIVTSIGAAARLEVHPTGTHFVRRIDRRTGPYVRKSALPQTKASATPGRCLRPHGDPPMTRRERNLRSRISVGSAVQALVKLGYPAPVSGPNPPDNPIFVVRLKPQSGDGVRSLRQFLKAALRHYQLRCLGVVEESPPQLIVEHHETVDDEAWGPTLPGYADDGKFYARVGPRPGRRTRWRSIRCGISPQQEVTMEKSDLEKLKRYASTTRSPLVFGGCPFIQWDWKLGKPLIGKKDATGRKFVADVPNVMVGFRHLEQGQKPAYALTRLLDPAADEIQRDELGQTDKAQWIDDKDPWVPCTVMPFFDPETRQVFILVAAYGERSETGALIHAFADHNEARPGAVEQLPIAQLGVREYTKNDGTPGFAMQLDIEGWTERPAAVFKVLPPPLNITATEPAKSNGKTASEAAAAADSSKDDKDKAAKPKRKVSIPGKPDYDDSVPFN